MSRTILITSPFEYFLHDCAKLCVQAIRNVPDCKFGWAIYSGYYQCCIDRLEVVNYAFLSYLTYFSAWSIQRKTDQGSVCQVAGRLANRPVARMSYSLKEFATFTELRGLDSALECTCKKSIRNVATLKSLQRFVSFSQYSAVFSEDPQAILYLV